MSGPRFLPLELKSLYTPTELARAASVHPRVIRRLVAESNIECVRMGRKWFVPLSEIAVKLPRLWESILAAEEARNRSIPV